MSEQKWTHDGLAKDLAGHLRETRDVMAWEDMQLGPSGSCRPDVYTMGKSYAHFNPLAYECKISVADFRSDVTSGKWQRYLNFASAVVFAVPAGLITKADIPAGCGLIVRSDSGWRMAKGPTLSHVATLPRDAWIKMLIDGIDRAASAHRCEGRGRANQWAVERAMRAKFGEDLAGLISRALRNRAEVEEAIVEDRRKRQEIIDGTERHAKMHREHIERELRTLSNEQKWLAKSLGLTEDATIHDLTRRIRQCFDRLGEDDEIKRLRGFFKQVKDLADRGLEPLPGLVETEEAGLEEAWPQ